MRVVVAGASGFVGRKLVKRLAEAGHDVLALSRHPDPKASFDNVEFRAVDVGDSEDLESALSGAEAAYYLIHSMAGEDFVRKDLQLATGFAEAAARAGVGRIVYQGALGRGKLSPHLSSRQEVGRALASTGVPVVELRAAVILGSGSTSFEMMRYLTERLPMMICPRWVRTRTEPVALSDVLEYLVRALEAPEGVYEIGCGEATSYQDMMHRYAAVRGLRYRPILNVPLLTLHLSGYWVDLVTPLDRKVTHSLIGSMTSNVTVRDAGRTLAAFKFEPLSLDESMHRALDDQAAEIPGHHIRRDGGLVRERPEGVPGTRGRAGGGCRRSARTWRPSVGTWRGTAGHGRGAAGSFSACSSVRSTRSAGRNAWRWARRRTGGSSSRPLTTLSSCAPPGG